MKIALLTSGLEHIKRGAEVSTQNLCLFLRKHGVEADLYKGSGKAVHDFEYIVPCLPRGNSLSKKIVEFFPAWTWHLGLQNEYEIEQQSFVFSIIVEMIRKRYHIIYTKDARTAEILLFLKNIGLLRSHIIVSNGTEPPLELLKKFRYVQFLSPHHLKDACLTVHDESITKDWFSIPNPVDTDKFLPVESDQRRKIRLKYGIPDDAVVVLSVCAINAFHKRIDYFLEEMADLTKKMQDNLFFVVCGSRTHETEQLEKQKSHLLGARCAFFSDINQSDMPEIYQMSDVFVLCSLKEMFGTVILEAMSSGLPCVVHDYPVFQLIFGDGSQCADLARSGNLKGAVSDLIQSKKSREIGVKNRQRVEKMFSSDIVTQKFITHFQEIIDGHG